MSIRTWCAAAVMALVTAVSGADFWTPDIAGKSVIDKQSDPHVVSGRTEIKQLEEGPALIFRGGQDPAVFSSKDILDNESGSIEFYFQPDLPEKAPAHASTLFISGKYSIGFYTSPGKVPAIYFLTKTTEGKPAGIYNKYPLQNGKWHHLKAYWDTQSMFLAVDGKFLASSGRGGSVFDSVFRIGDGQGGFCRAKIRDFRIYKGTKNAAAPQKKK